jgi:hypothetical protein
MSLPSTRIAKRASALTPAQWVAGADGCRGGWFVVLCAIAQGADRPLQVTSRLCPDVEALLSLPEDPVAIAIDMPIGCLIARFPAAASAIGGRARCSAGRAPAAYSRRPRGRASRQSTMRKSRRSTARG